MAIIPTGSSSYGTDGDVTSRVPIGPHTLLMNGPAADMLSNDTFHSVRAPATSKESFFQRVHQEVKTSVTNIWSDIVNSFYSMFQGAATFPKTLWYALIGKPQPSAPENFIVHNPGIDSLYEDGKKVLALEKEQKKPQYGLP